MILLTYVLSDLPSDAARIAATQLMFELLDENGMIVIVESGNPLGSHMTRTARQFILDLFNKRSLIIKNEDQLNTQNTSNEKDESSKRRFEANVPLFVLPPPSSFTSNSQLEATVVSPCTHDHECPLSDKSWCSFSQRVCNCMNYIAIISIILYGI